MASIVYNKLVRDKIPQIIEAAGKTAKTEILSDEAYLRMLDQKLLEEANEYLASGATEELADIAEVFYTILSARGISLNELEQLRQQKAAERGGFEKKILLLSVESNPRQDTQKTGND